MLIAQHIARMIRFGEKERERERDSSFKISFCHLTGCRSWPTKFLSCDT